MSKKNPRWQLAKKILTWLFFIAVIVLLVVYARKVKLGDVYKVIVGYNRYVVLSRRRVSGGELPHLRSVRFDWPRLLRA